MKKIYIVLLMLLLVLGGCRSLTKKGRSVNQAEKYIEAGDYYSGVEVLSMTLVTNPDYKPALEMINVAFPTAINEAKNNVESLRDSEDYITFAESNERVLNLYKFVSRLGLETQSYLNFPIDYENLKYWTRETSKAYYQAGESFVNPQGLDDYKAIAKLYKKSYTYNPKYMDNLEKYRSYKELAMQHVLYFPTNYNYEYYSLGSIIDETWLNSLNSNASVKEFTKLYSAKDLGIKTGDELDEKYNRSIKVEVILANYDGPRRRQNYYTEYWYEELKLVDGVLIKDYKRYKPSNPESGVRYVEHRYTKVENIKEATGQVIINYEVMDLIDNKVIKSGRIDKKVEDSTTWYTYWGNTYPGTFMGTETNLKDKFTLLKEASILASEELSTELINILK